MADTDTPSSKPRPDPLPAASANTLKAYAQDWAHFTRWCRMAGAAPLPPTPETVALYLADLASGSAASPALSAPTIDRRLSGLVWILARRGVSLDRKSQPIASVLADIKRGQTRLPQQKHAIHADDILAMVATLPHDLRGLRDRAILLLGFAGRLRRSEIVSLDRHRHDTPDAGGWVEIHNGGVLLTLGKRTARRAIEIPRGTSDHTCPVHALEHWLRFARIDRGPVFVATSRDGARVLDRRLNDKHVARLIKRTVLDAGLRSELPVKERLALFSGQSLRVERLPER